MDASQLRVAACALVANAALGGSSEADGGGLLDDERHGRSFEMPERVIIADQPWEYRPRAKIRRLLLRRWRDQDKEGDPAIAQHERFVALARFEIGLALVASAIEHR